VTGLLRVERTEQLADKIIQMWVKALHVTNHTQAGLFAVFRTDEGGERIPLTITTLRRACVRFIFMAIGKTTERFGAHKRGDSIRDGLGSLGKPSEIAKYGFCVVVEGGGMDYE